VKVPGDKSISHRALILAGVAEGTSLVRGRSDGDDVRRTEEAMRALGARVDDERIAGGEALLHEPSGPIDLGNSGTGIRLLAGVVAGWPWEVELTGDESLSGRPMDRIATPLRLMGARVEGRTDRCLPPLLVGGGSLRGIDYTPPMASAQVKSCILLAGLMADGATVVREPVPTRAHTEELLALCGADVSTTREEEADVVRLVPGKLSPFEIAVPGDPSQAAFWIVAACLVPGSDVTVERVYTGAARRGFIDVLKRMGAHITETSAPDGDGLGSTSDVVARSSALVSTEIDASEIPSLDEVPVLAVAASLAEGTTVFKAMEELRVKESDRFAAVVDLVRAFGAGAEVDGNDIYVTGVPALEAGDVDAKGDHRIAMAAAIAAACVPGRPSRILGWESVNTSYPSFRVDLAKLTGASA
jgi:3-phosphoshikimate 1-carboxyvinyltransferase